MRKKILLLLFLYYFSLINAKGILENKIIDLIKQLADDKAYVRNSARTKLATIGKDIIPFIKSVYRKSNYYVRRELVSVLADIKTQESVNILLICLKDEDYGVRNRASISLLNLSNNFKNIFDKIKSLSENISKKSILSPKEIEIKSSVDYLFKSIVYKLIETKLSGLISPQGGYGFYDGQFDDILYLKSAAVDPLLDIFSLDKPHFVISELNNNNEKHYKMRLLAGQAIGDFKNHLGTKKKKVVKKLKTLSYHKEKDIKEIASYTLYALGEDGLLKRQINSYRYSLRRNPFNYEAYFELGMIYLRIRKVKEGIEMLKKAVKYNSSFAIGYYNLACAYACNKQIEEGIVALETAVDKGYEDIGWIKRDGDLKNLKSHPKYKKLLKKLEKKLENK